MKILALLLSIVTVLPSAAQSVAVSGAQGAKTAPQQISVAFDNTPLEDAIWTIARRSGRHIIFDQRVLPAKKVSYRADAVAPDAALAVVLKGTGLRVEQSRNGILKLVPVDARKADGVVAGKVPDGKTGRGISGATVSAGSDARGVVTGEDGSYRISGIATRPHTVSVRLVGYAKQTRSVTVGEEL